MAPAPIDERIKDVAQPKKDTLGLPEPALKRLQKAGVDLSQGYPYRPSRPLYLQDVLQIRSEEWKHDDAGARADKSKSALLSAATKVTDLTVNIGTEIEGLQLKDLTDQQRDELALLIAERSVVFFRDQDLSPQQQLELGEYYGKPEIHVSFSFICLLSSLSLPLPLSHHPHPHTHHSPSCISSRNIKINETFPPPFPQTTAPSSPSARQPRRIGDLAGALGHGAEGQLPQPGRGVAVALGPGARAAAGGDHAPAQRHGAGGGGRHAVGERVLGVREAEPGLPEDHRRQAGRVPVGAPVRRPGEPRGRPEAHRARASPGARAPRHGLEGPLGQSRHDRSHCRLG